MAGCAAAVVVVVATVVFVVRGGGATSPGAARDGVEATVSTITDYEQGDVPSDGLASPTASATSSASAASRHTTPRSTPVAWFTVTLGASCVVPGGTQTLTAQSRPGYTVAYNSHYVDGKAGDAYGGYGVVPTDAHGRVVAMWTVSAAAPLGPVTIGAGTANGGTPTTATRSFVLASHC
jgi:hypothetical protein